jgi:hypothetical protein
VDTILKDLYVEIYERHSIKSAKIELSPANVDTGERQGGSIWIATKVSLHMLTAQVVGILN